MWACLEGRKQPGSYFRSIQAPKSLPDIAVTATGGQEFSIEDFPVTFWVSDVVPVAVQCRINNPDLGGMDPVQTFELSAWG